MKAERKSRGQFYRRGLVVWSLVVFCACLAAQAGPQWRIIPVEVDGEKNTAVAGFALGSDGTPWVALSQPQGAICYWQDGQWHKIAGEFFVDPYRTQLQVAPTGRVYLSQMGPRGFARGQTPLNPHSAVVYLLADRHAEQVTEYYYDTAGMPPQLYFDSKGRIWNWGQMFLAKFENGQWERVEASLGQNTQVIEDVAGNVYFFGKALSYCRDGKIIADAKPLPFPWEKRPGWEQQPVKGYLWGADKALFFSGMGTPGAIVFDLNTLTVSDVLHSAPLPMDALRGVSVRRPRGGPDAGTPLLLRSSLYDAFRDTEGNLWVLATNQNVRAYHYIKISAADNRVEDKPETAAIDWGSSMDSRRKPVLCARHGTIYIGGVLDGVYIYRNGVLTHTDWQQGLALNETNWIGEHPDGTIWFASLRTGIAVYDPQATPGTGPTSPFQTTWEEYPLVGDLMAEGPDGGLWCFLKSQTSKVSHWDGRTWEHVELGLGGAEVLGLWVDDLRRLLVLAISGRESAACRLANGHVDWFPDFKEMVLDSVRSGARRFQGNGNQPTRGPLVVSEQEIWCTDARIGRLMRYNGQTWNEVTADLYRSALFRHKDNQVLLGLTGADRRFQALDRGQLVEFADEHTRKQEYLLGESGLQPFDEQVYQQRKGELFLAREVERTLYVFESLEDFQVFTKANIPPRTANLGRDLNRLWLAVGGFWSHNGNLPQIRRYYKGLVLDVDLSLTPVVKDLWGGNIGLVEDAAGDLWIRRHDRLYHVKRPRLDTQITAPQSAECGSPTLRVEFTGTANGSRDETLTYAWRLDGGPWSKPSDQKYADLEFVQAGAHEFEVTAIGSMGNLDTTPAVLKLNATIPTPEVRIVSAPKEVVTDLDVAIGYEVVKRAPSSKLSFQWRVDGGPWRDTREMVVRPTGLQDGEHLFEVRAVENDKYVQTPPASVRFTLKIDYEKAIQAAIKELGTSDYERRKAAVNRLAALGPRSIPYLKKELAGADEDKRWWIQAALTQIEK
jgi:hypothetical protein